MFKKIVSLMLIFVLSIGILPNGKAIAEELIQDENIEVLENNSEKVEVQTEVETVEGDAIVSAAWDKSDNAFTVKSMETDANGNEVEKEYRVDVEEATEDVFKATFTDVKTNESFEVDSTEARASVAFFTTDCRCNWSRTCFSFNRDWCCCSNCRCNIYSSRKSCCTITKEKS